MIEVVDLVQKVSLECDGDSAVCAAPDNEREDAKLLLIVEGVSSVFQSIEGLLAVVPGESTQDQKKRRPNTQTNPHEEEVPSPANARYGREDQRAENEGDLDAPEEDWIASERRTSQKILRGEGDPSDAQDEKSSDAASGAEQPEQPHEMRRHVVEAFVGNSKCVKQNDAERFASVIRIQLRYSQ